MKKVTVVGAGKYGSMTALRVAEYDLVDSVVMTDIVDGLPQGLALDMNQSRYVENFSSKIIGTNDYEDTAEDRKSTRLNSSHVRTSRMPSSA